MRRLALLLLAFAAGCGSSTVSQPVGGSPSAEPEPVGSVCPQEFGSAEGTPWVPAPPSTETDGRLAPDADPVEAVVCRYDPLTEQPSLLEGEVRLAEGLRQIRHDLLLPQQLDGQSQACTAIGGPRVPHLLHLRYADGELWVSSIQDVNSCELSGNGSFVSAAYTGDQLAASYDAGSWTPPPRARPAPGTCSPTSAGRLGQERELVPDGWTTVLLCRDGGPANELDAGTGERVAAVLRDVATRPGGNSCAGTPRSSYDLVFAYDAGPAVSVSFLPGCEPALRNGSLDGLPSQEQIVELEALLRE